MAKSVTGSLLPQDAVLAFISKGGEMGCLTPPKQHQCVFRIGKSGKIGISSSHLIEAPWLMWSITAYRTCTVHILDESALFNDASPQFKKTPYGIANVDPTTGTICFDYANPRSLKNVYNLFWSMGFDDSMSFRFFDAMGSKKSFAHTCRLPSFDSQYPQHDVPTPTHTCPDYTLPECRWKCECCRGTCECARCRCCNGTCHCWGNRHLSPAHIEWATRLFTDLPHQVASCAGTKLLQASVYPRENLRICSGYQAFVYLDESYCFANPQDPDNFAGDWVTETGEIVSPIWRN